MARDIEIDKDGSLNRDDDLARAIKCAHEDFYQFSEQWRYEEDGVSDTDDDIDDPDCMPDVALELTNDDVVFRFDAIIQVTVLAHNADEAVRQAILYMTSASAFKERERIIKDTAVCKEKVRNAAQETAVSGL